MLGLLEGLRRHDIVGDIAGSGLFIAVELVHDADRSDAPGPILPAENQVAGVARRLGLFVRPLGGTIILGPPLIFTKAQAERTVDVLDTALAEVEARVPAEVGR
jgi:adenosylmethionine-8-amino-7-oxononanoate aminotransferase